MSSPHGSIDCDCDAPPYGIVQACETLGFQSPLDVRWLRMSHFLERPRGPHAALELNFWARLFAGGRAPETTCPCGQPLPPLEPYAFMFASGKQLDYLLGQCRRCHTMFWEEPTSAPGGTETHPYEK